MEKNLFDKELVESLMLRPTVEELMASFEHRGYEIVKQTKVDFGDMEWLIITDDFYRMPYIIPTCKYGIAWRTKKLTEYGMIHRAIKPEITPDELLYNMYIDASCFTEIEGGYPVDMIVSLAELVLKESIENCRKTAKDNEKNSIIINLGLSNNCEILIHLFKKLRIALVSIPVQADIYYNASHFLILTRSNLQHAFLAK